MKMRKAVFFALVICSIDYSSAEVHSLEYIYTVSKPVGAPSVCDFTAMTLLDGKQIDWYNNQDKRKIARQKWMGEKFESAYWEAGTQICRNEEQWFKDGIIDLMEQMQHSSSGLHVLQWRRGCVGEGRPGRTLMFTEGFNQYGYDGEDFLRLNFSTSQWDFMVPQAESTKDKWDQTVLFNKYTKEYLQTDCLSQLDGFMTYAEEDLKKHSPPEILTYAKKSNNPDKVILHCMATGFYPKDAEVNIYRNGIIMNEGDGVTSSGIRSNGVWPNWTVDDTYQLKKSVEILKSEHGSYICNITHRSLREPVSSKWSDGPAAAPPAKGAVPNGGPGVSPAIIIGVIMGVAASLLFILVFPLLFFFKWKRRASTNVEGLAAAPANGGIDHDIPTVQVGLLNGISRGGGKGDESRSSS